MYAMILTSVHKTRRAILDLETKYGLAVYPLSVVIEERWGRPFVRIVRAQRERVACTR